MCCFTQSILTLRLYVGGRTDARTDGRMDGRTDRQMDGWIDGLMNGWMGGCNISLKDCLQQAKIMISVPRCVKRYTNVQANASLYMHAVIYSAKTCTQLEFY
jgi:hypothetical protein